MGSSETKITSVVDGALIDTDVNVLSSVAVTLLLAARISNMRNFEAILHKKQVDFQVSVVPFKPS